MSLTIEMLKEQIDGLTKRVEQVEKCKNENLIRKNLVVGDTFEIDGLSWRILDITETGYMCLAETLDIEKRFDNDSNDWKNSYLRGFLNNEFFEKLCKQIGEENIVSFERNLLSLDGQTEYGTCKDKVSLLSVDEYRKYRSMIPNTEDNWWWLLTPWSTKTNGNEYGMAVVAPSGCVCRRGCSYGCGVRPFCIFSSSIFESRWN